MYFIYNIFYSKISLMDPVPLKKTLAEERMELTPGNENSYD